jgi:hypothetical protein
VWLGIVDPVQTTLFEMSKPADTCRRWDTHALDGLDVLDPSNVSEEAMTVGEAMHARTERLSRHTREHIHDVNKWLQYALHQQDLLVMSGETHVLCDVVPLHSLSDV